MSIEWKNRLSSKVYRDNLVGFVVEVDDIYRFFIIRGEKFGAEFSHLGEMR